MKIQDLYPLIADGKIPDYPVQVFADGQPAKLTWKWEFVRPADEEDEQPPEGTNHLRINVKTEWQPTDRDFTNIPEPNPEYLLLIVSRRKSGRQVVFHCHNYGGEKVWMDYTDMTPEDAFDGCNMDVVEFKIINL